MRRSRVPASIGTMVLAALAVAGGFVPVAAQGATPPALPATPEATACTVEPRPLAFFEQLVGTPAPGPAPPAAAGTMVPIESAMAAGSPADAETRAGVTATLLELAACLNAGDRLRYYALYTDEFFGRLVAEIGPLPAEFLTYLVTPAPLPAENRAALLAVLDVRALTAGRAAALAEVLEPGMAVAGPARAYLELVERDGRWLVDVHVITVAPDQVTAVPIDPATATAAPARAGSVADACPIPPALRGVHGSVVSSVGAADEGGVYVAASIQVVECDRGDPVLTSQDATLVALDPATGAERWRFASGARRMTPPVVADGLAYVVGDSFDDTGTLHAVDAATGQERWRFGTGATFSAPVVAGGVVYAAGGAAAPDLGGWHLYALDAASGTERWRRSDVPYGSRLAVDQGTVYVGSFSDCAVWHLAAFDAATGAERSSWSIETPTRNCPVAWAVADGVAYIVRLTGEGGLGDGYLAALDPATGAERWRWGFDPGGLAVTPVVHAGTVYVNGLDTLHAVDAAGGAERWHFGAGGFLWPAVAADGTVYVAVTLFGAGDRAALDAIDEATGTERWRFPTKASPTLSEPGFPVVAVAEGVAYVGGGETIYAVDAASGAERWRSRLALALPATTPDGDSSPAAGS